MATATVKLSFSRTKGFYKVIGYAVGSKGKLEKKKWYFGFDRDKAELLAKRIKREWRHLKAAETKGTHLVGDGLAYDPATDTMLHQGELAMFAEVAGRSDLDIFKLAGRMGLPTSTLNERVRVKGPPHFNEAFIKTIRGYKDELYGKATTTPAATPPALATPAAETPAETAGQPQPPKSLYAAIDRFKATVEADNERSQGWRFILCHRLERLKDALADMPLDQFGIEQIQKLRSYFAGRPFAKAVGRGRPKHTTKKRISVDTAIAEIRAARQFVDWLDSTNWWDAPKKWERLFQRIKRRAMAAIDKDANAGRVIDTFNLDELTKLWQATKQPTHKLIRADRLQTLMLLALNCGMTQSEMAGLTVNHLHLDGDAPYIAMERAKTGVPGQWRLWPETVEAMRRELAAMPADHAGPILLTANGKPLVWYNAKQRVDAVANLWNRLVERAAVRPLAFKYLRKTGSQFVRDAGGKENSEVYLCHADQTTGKHYNNANFDALADVLVKVRQNLEPMFTAVEVTPAAAA